MKKILFFVVILSHLASCKQIIKEGIRSVASKSGESESLSDDNFNEITIDDTYKLSVPKYMKAMPNLNEEASLQYANIYKEAYTIVLNESKEEFVDYFKELEEYNDSLSVIENYSLVQEQFYKEGMSNYKIEHYGLTNINDYNARQIKFTGKFEGQELAYLVAFIEGEEQIFLIMNWTLLDRLDRFENTFEMINASFFLVNNSNN